ncbi:MAG TPA: FAD-binding oxidoreductase [Candidatus Limnocylindrales bacterium]|nr:FAD-binding oxidoreductase [Candidatus Limnocylindrales bacterium]
MQTDDQIAPAASFPATAILPDHPAYDEHRISFNGMLDRRPAVIVPCTSTDEVVGAVRAARTAGLPIAVRGGGHSVAGHGVADGALVVSLGSMRDVTVDPERRIAHVGGGAQWNDIDAAAFAHGLAVPGGTFGDTGVGGLTLGGGIGWLMPVAGLTCDNLIEAEVVTADGSVVIAGPGGDEELLWALRGGGGNFGVVTRFTYRLTPVGPMFGGEIRYLPEAAGEVLARVETLIARYPLATMPTLTIHRDPDLGPIVAFLLGIVDGSDPEPILELLRRDLPVVDDDLGTRTYLDLQALAGILPFGLRHYWKGHFVRELDTSTFEALVAAVSAPDAVGKAFVLIEGITGAGRTEPAGGAAFGQRAARWNASALSIWESPDEDEVAIGWARRVADLLEPLSQSGGGYINYSPADESAERVVAAYGAERWERLVAVKRRHDPANVFRFNHNIRPD